MNKYLSIITLNANLLNSPIKRHRVAEWTRNYDPHISCLQKIHLRTRDLHRLKVNGCKKKIPNKWPGKKKIQDSTTHIRQNTLQNKGYKKRHRMTLHNTQLKNPSRIHKYYKHICTQHRSTKIYKEKSWRTSRKILTAIQS